MTDRNKIMVIRGKDHAHDRCTAILHTQRDIWDHRINTKEKAKVVTLALGRF